jgi:formylglycine-generating enzyme
MASKLLVLVLVLASVQGSIAQSEISFEWVTVGDPGNPNDPLTGISSGGTPTPTRGAVPYVYSISKYETTIGQYTAFLNAVARSDPHGLYNTNLGNVDLMRGIVRSGTDGNYVYSVKNAAGGEGLTSANLPIAYMTFFDAARLVNWLHTMDRGTEVLRRAPTPSAKGRSRGHRARARSSLLQPPSHIPSTWGIW